MSGEDGVVDAALNRAAGRGVEPVPASPSSGGSGSRRTEWDVHGTNGRATWRRRIGVVGGIVLAPVLIAGCSSSGGGGGSTTSAAPPASPSATTSETGSGGAGMIGPVILTAEQPDGSVTLGRTVVFDLGDDPSAWDLVTSDPGILALSPGGTRDGATFNWGAETLNTGRASVVATPKGTGTPVTFLVTVTPAT